MTVRLHPPSAAAGRPQPASRAGGSVVLVGIFLLLLLLPLRPEVAGLRLDPYRVFLLLVMVAAVPAFLSGRAGPFRLPDALMIGLGIWMVVTLVLHHGMERLPYAVTQMADLVGGYMLARMSLRGIEDFRRFVGVYFAFLLVLLPFAIVEFLTSNAPLLDFLGRFGPTINAHGTERNGFFRAQVVFPHSILFGVFCSIALSNVLYARGALPGRLLRAGITSFLTLLSLSSAAALSLMLQAGLAFWGRFTGRRWGLLLGLAVFIFVFLEFASNRGPFILLIETLTFNPQTGWWRVFIWEYGSKSVLDHPLFGIGMNDWARPEWMLSGSVDNFWLLLAMRYGLPASFLLALAMALLLVGMLRRPLSREANEIRTGYVIGWVALAFVLCTVHIWDALAAFVSFYFGAAAAFLTPHPEAARSTDDHMPKQTAGFPRPSREATSAGSSRFLPFSRYPVRGRSGSEGDFP